MWLCGAVRGLNSPPKGVASRRKFSTCVFLRLRLVRPSVKLRALTCTCVYLRWLAMTCAHFGRDQIRTQASRRKFFTVGHPTQQKSTQTVLTEQHILSPRLLLQTSKTRCYILAVWLSERSSLSWKLHKFSRWNPKRVHKSVCSIVKTMLAGVDLAMKINIKSNLVGTSVNSPDNRLFW